MPDDKLTETVMLPARSLSPAAQRARAEAAENEAKTVKSTEINGRTGPEPVRYGDWEVNGIASDF
jgi:hypothetical protein